MIIAVDAMGGDHGASAVCPGAIEACRTNPGLEIALIGDKAVIEPYLDKADAGVQRRITVVHTNEMVDPDEPPTKAIRQSSRASGTSATIGSASTPRITPRTSSRRATRLWPPART